MTQKNLQCSHGSHHRRRPIKILCVGDGDMTLSLALLRAYNNGSQIIVEVTTTTIVSSEEELMRTYPRTAPYVLNQLKEAQKKHNEQTQQQCKGGVSTTCITTPSTILYNVDACNLHDPKGPVLQSFNNTTGHRNYQINSSMGKPFDLVLFHHPHLGEKIINNKTTKNMYHDVNDQDYEETIRLQRHRTLLGHYLWSASQISTYVHVCLCGNQPYSWKLHELAIQRLKLNDALRPQQQQHGESSTSANANDHRKSRGNEQQQLHSIPVQKPFHVLFQSLFSSKIATSTCSKNENDYLLTKYTGNNNNVETQDNICMGVFDDGHFEDDDQLLLVDVDTIVTVPVSKYKTTAVVSEASRKELRQSRRSSKTSDRHWLGRYGYKHVRTDGDRFINTTGSATATPLNGLGSMHYVFSSPSKFLKPTTTTVTSQETSSSCSPSFASDSIVAATTTGNTTTSTTDDNIVHCSSTSTNNKRFDNDNNHPAAVRMTTKQNNRKSIEQEQQHECYVCGMIFSNPIELEKHWISPAVPVISSANLYLAEETTTVCNDFVLPNTTENIEEMILNGHDEKNTNNDDLVTTTTQVKNMNYNHEDSNVKEMKDATLSNRVDSNYSNNNGKQHVVFTERIVSSQYDGKRLRWYLQHSTSASNTTTTPTSCSNTLQQPLPNFSKRAWEDWIVRGNVTINGIVATDGGRIVRTGNSIVVVLLQQQQQLQQPQKEKKDITIAAVTEESGNLTTIFSKGPTSSSAFLIKRTAESVRIPILASFSIATNFVPTTINGCSTVEDSFGTTTANILCSNNSKLVQQQEIAVVWKLVGIRSIGSFDTSTLEQIISRQQQQTYNCLSNIDTGCSGLCVLLSNGLYNHTSIKISSTFTALVYGTVPKEWDTVEGIHIQLPIGKKRRWKRNGCMRNNDTEKKIQQERNENKNDDDVRFIQTSSDDENSSNSCDMNHHNGNHSDDTFNDKVNVVCSDPKYSHTASKKCQTCTATIRLLETATLLAGAANHVKHSYTASSTAATVPALSTVSVTVHNAKHISGLGNCIAYFLRTHATTMNTKGTLKQQQQLGSSFNNNNPVVGDRYSNNKEYISLPRSVRNRLKQRLCLGCTAVTIRTTGNGAFSVNHTDVPTIASENPNTIQLVATTSKDIENEINNKNMFVTTTTSTTSNNADGIEQIHTVHHPIPDKWKASYWEQHCLAKLE